MDVYGVDMHIDQHTARQHDHVIPAVDMAFNPSTQNKLVLDDFELKRAEDLYDKLSSKSDADECDPFSRSELDLARLTELKEGVRMSRPEATGLIQELDLNHDGKVTRQEFLHHLALVKAKTGSMNLCIKLRQLTLHVHGYTHPETSLAKTMSYPKLKSHRHFETDHHDVRRTSTS